MGFLGQTFNVNELQDGQSFDPIPAGQYVTTIEDAEIKTTKAGTGTYLKLKMKVSEGAYQNRVLFSNITVTNPSETAVKIGEGQIKALMRAIGLSSLRDTDQLVGQSVLAKVTISHSSEYGDSNDVKGFASVGGSPMPSSPAQPSKASSKPPWAS